MPNRYEIVFSRAAVLADQRKEHKRALARILLRAKEQRWAWESYDRMQKASGYNRATYDGGAS